MVASDTNRKLRRILENPWLAVALIALTAVIIYSNIYQGEFVFDDVRTIEENQDIRDLSKFLSLKQFVKKRPIVVLTFALNYRFGGLNVFGYHLVNLIIHIINGVIVYFLALTIFRQVGGRRTEVRGRRTEDGGNLTCQSPINNQQSSIPLAALFAALIFIAHPIQTQAVTYTTQRYASLAALFFMASVLFYLKGRILCRMSDVGGRRTEVGGQGSEVRGRRSEGRGAFSLQPSAFYVLCIISGILAFMSKQNTASLPAVILLVEYLCIDSSWAGWKKKLPWIGLAFVLCLTAVLYVSGAFGVVGRGGSLLEDVSDFTRDSRVISRWSYLCTQFNVVVVYIRLLFFPVGQNADDMYPFRTGFFDGVTPLAFLFLAGLVLLAVWRRKKTPVITLAIFWFFITLSVESSIIPIRDALFEHRLYLPMFGFALAVSYMVFHLLAKKGLWAFMISLGMILALGTATYQRNKIWQKKRALWSDVLSKSPWNYRAHCNLGIVLSGEGKLEEAISHLSEALRFNPGHLKARMNMGNVMAMQGKYKEAVEYFSGVLAVKPKDAKTQFNLGTALAHQGRLEEAVNHFNKVITINPNFTEARINLGIALMRRGRIEEAIGHFKKALKVNPGQKGAHTYLGIALAKQGNLKGAADEFAGVLRIDPYDVRARTNLGTVLAQQGKINAAIKQFREVLRIKPDSRIAMRNLTILIRKNAEKHKRRGQNLGPRN